MKPILFILAYRESAFLPVFRRPPALRLAQLAADLGREVRVLVTPELQEHLRALKGSSPAGVSWQVVAGAEALAALLAPYGDEPLPVLKGHALWDRKSLETWLAAATAGSEGLGDWGGILPARRWGPVIAGWLAAPAATAVTPGSGLPYLLHPDLETLKEAEARLLAAQAAATAASDGFLARQVDRRLSRLLSPALVRLGVKPNWITLLNTGVGLAGAWLLAQADYPAHLLGAALFLVVVILDGVDGEVARLTLQETSFGHYLDLITDNVVHVAVFVGLAVGLSRATNDVSHLYALAALLGGFGLCALAVYQVLLQDQGLGPEYRARTTRWLSRLANRDFAYLVLVLAVLDRLAWFLWGAMVGCYVFALGLWLLGHVSRKKQTAGNPVSYGPPTPK
jgi:phosphatidylglycerophosphate synthase